MSQTLMLLVFSNVQSFWVFDTCIQSSSIFAIVHFSNASQTPLKCATELSSG